MELIATQGIFDKSEHFIEGGPWVTFDHKTDELIDRTLMISRKEFVLLGEPSVITVKIEKGNQMKAEKREGNFRKKPVVIEAKQWDGTAEGATSIIDWILENGGTARYVDPDPAGFDTVLRIDTLEGTVSASPQDFVIKGVQNEFYPCKPDIFRETYDSVDA